MDWTTIVVGLTILIIFNEIVNKINEFKNGNEKRT